MNVLVLGGTVFFGRHLVAALIARGRRVTTFNRGTHEVDAELPIARITGDCTQPGGLDAIPTAGWDAVIDPSSDHVEAAAQHLREWFARSGRATLRCGLEPQREMELLDTWNAAISS